MNTMHAGSMLWILLFPVMCAAVVLAAGKPSDPSVPVKKARLPGCRTPWICGPADKDCGNWGAGPIPTCRVRAPKLKFVCLQLDASAKTKAARLTAAVDLLEQAAAAEGPGVYLLPEYTLCPMSGDNPPAGYQEPIPGPATEVFARIADKHNLWVGVGMAEQSADPKKPYNTVVFVGPHGQLHRYRKTHLFEPGVEAPLRETQVYTPGETLDVFDIEGWCIGAMICADGFFPEVPRVLALKGAQVILYANGRNRVGPEAEAACMANAAVVVVCNYTGNTPTERAMGTSRILEPPWAGVVAAIQGAQQGWIAKEYLYSDIARMRNLEVIGRAPFIDPRSRRPELYGPITDNDACLLDAF